MVENKVLCPLAHEVHEGSRDQRKLLARRIDEIPMSFKGESLDVERNELCLFGIEPKRITRPFYPPFL
ncbi:MAG: hypothetical protein A3F74_25515 [Betaproteobacteria bacterium RIFCSPLOWO2_12_FULL_62_58]|nr:MAG: hypothetical protein A3I62_05510 [Betaproteobacteria bacterium RIFCSPLOWO2_02_FULL_62_79]OGA49625.1 MAG: hypothetical protein A3F74_25515 [Betaproteobacteria bacterium RIFCSPLOWO2_12_FULL_62_58]